MTDPVPSWLPEVLADIAEAAGLDAALKLAEHYGGTRRKIPAHAGDDHWLVQCVGRKAADSICALFRQGADARQSGQEIVIPLGPTGTMRAARRRMINALEAGAPAREAARAAGMHERSAYRMRRRLKSDDGQGSLF